MGKETKKNTKSNKYYYYKPNQEITENNYQQDLKYESSSETQPQSPEKTINSKNYQKKHKYEEYSSSNKFDTIDFSKTTPFYLPIEKNSRKQSRDSENYSTSNEDKDNIIEYPNKFSRKNKNKKEPFKTCAHDFKVKYKTELCKYFEINGYCKYGDNCAYAHGKENLRSKVTNTTAYRSKKCTQFFEMGYCPYGNRCQFAHQLQSNIINNPYDKKMSYSKILEIISKVENIDNIKKLVEKPRLNVFKEIIDDKNVKSTLLDDIKNLIHDKDSWY